MKKRDFLYQSIVNSIDDLLDSLGGLNDNDEVLSIKEAAIREFSQIKNSLKESIESLNHNSEWERFTIAFYGETNAGKSTLIEVLRILLNEKTKEKERLIFSEANQKYTKVLEEIEKIRNNIDETGILIDETKTSFSNYKQGIDDELNHDLDEWIFTQCKIWAVSSVLHKKIASDNLCFFKSIFNKTSEQLELSELKKHLSELISDHQEKEINLSESEKKTELELEVLANNKVQLVNLLTQQEREEKNLIVVLKDSSDGQNIDAHTDFTKRIAQYDIKSENSNISILDLPGIEGDEKLVQDEIQKAIEKAHVVFYISKKARAPQKGDELNKGTIEKIRDQLASQTEVYFIFNKGTPNPNQLGASLASDDEEKALLDVDEKMNIILGERYKGHISLSAYPPFVAYGNFADGSFLKSKEKFLSRFSCEDILNFSKLNSFCEWITKVIPQDYKRKIVASNTNKLIVTIDKTTKTIQSNINKLDEIKSKSEADLPAVKEKLEISKDNLMNEISDILDKKIRKFMLATRRELYDVIDQEINNKDLSSCVKATIEKNKSILEFEHDFDESFKNFEETTSQAIKEHQAYISELLGLYKNDYKIAFNESLEIKTNSKGDAVAVVVALVGAAAAWWFELGTVAIVTAVVTAAWTLIKNILGYFDKGYKKGQQKKAVDKSLYEIKEDFTEKTIEYSENIINQINTSFEKIYTELDNEIEQINEAIDVHNICLHKMNAMISDLERSLDE